METYTVILSPEPDGGYAVFCPAMPGAVSQGDDRAEALANIAESMTGWLIVARNHGRDALIETPALIAEMVAEVLQDREDMDLDMTIETVAVQLALAAAAA